MSSETAFALLTIVIALATWFLDRRADAREARKADALRMRDEARVARETGREQRRHEYEKSIEESRYAHEQSIRATERLASWAGRVTFALSRADHMMNAKTACVDLQWKQKEVVELGAELSSLIDEGRWLFRNHHTDDFGKEKAKINQGFRDNRLDALIVAYQALMGDLAVEPMRSRKDFVWKIQGLSLPLTDQVRNENT